MVLVSRIEFREDEEHAKRGAGGGGMDLFIYSSIEPEKEEA